MKAVWIILKKDLQIEFRAKEAIAAMWIFSLLIFVVFNFTFEASRLLMLQVSPGLLWVAYLFSGMLGLNRAFAVEKENGNFTALALAPVDAGWIYLGKFLSTTIFMMLFEILIFPIFLIFYDISLNWNMLWLPVVIGLGTIGFTSLGTLLAAVSMQTKNQQILLSLLLWPLITPNLIWSVHLTGEVLAGKLLDDFTNLMLRVTAFDLIFLAVSFMLFEYVLE